MATELATLNGTSWWRRALRAAVRALSAPSETDAFAVRDEDTVFQPRAAAARAAPRPAHRNVEN